MLFIPGKPESTYLLLLQFCHSILIQNQVFIIRLYSQRSFMTPGSFQLRRNFLFTTSATAATKMKTLEKFLVSEISVFSSECESFIIFDIAHCKRCFEL